MNDSLDLYQALWNSTFFSKIIFLGLIALSIYSWSLFIKKIQFFRIVKKNEEEFLGLYKSLSNLNDILRQSKEHLLAPSAVVFQKGYEEFLRISKKFEGQQKKDLLVEHFSAFGLESIERALKQGVLEVNLSMSKSVNFFANLGATCPFIGLLGTVIGIISTFKSMSTAGVGIEQVAPGLAEALLATALGLFVAIPSVPFYNFFSYKIDKMNVGLEIFSNDFINVIERVLIQAKTRS